MHRREFVGGALSGLLAYTGTCCRGATAESTNGGCWLAGAGDASFRASLKPAEGLYFGVLTGSGRQYFNIKPAIFTYNDVPPNAMATREVMREENPDGTVLIGSNLLNKFGILGLNQAVLVIAHEMAHILQFKRGMKPGDSWHMEPHADFMAGWVCGRDADTAKQMNLSSIPDIDQLAAFTFGLGDTRFNDQHHGEPQLRATMVRIGFEAGFESKLSVDAAFEKGLKMSGLT
jgi:hypothetical protein